MLVNAHIWFKWLCFVLLAGLLACSPSERPATLDDGNAGHSSASVVRQPLVIAILPWLSEGDDDTDVLAEGFSAHLMQMFSRDASITVIAKETAQLFTDSSELNSIIGKTLAATHVLRVRLRKENGLLWLNAELFQTDNGKVIWAHQYQRTQKELLALQSELDAALLTALQRSPETAVIQDDRPPGKQLSAYLSVLEGEHALLGSDVFSAQQAVKALKTATTLAPDYGYAYARLAWARLQQLSRFSQIYTEQAAAEQAQAWKEAEIALNHAPELPEVYLARAAWQLDVQHDPQAALMEIQTGLHKRPNDAVLLRQQAVRQIGFGQLTDAVETLRRELKINPRSASALYSLGNVYFALTDYAQAEFELRKALAIAPTLPMAHAVLAMALFQQNQTSEAVEIAKQEPEVLWRNYALAMAHWAKGERAASDAALQVLIREHAGDAATQIAGVYAQRDDAEAMFHWLEVAHQQGDPGIFEIRYMPFIARYQDDPRFVAIAQRVGVMPKATRDQSME